MSGSPGGVGGGQVAVPPHLRRRPDGAGAGLSSVRRTRGPRFERGSSGLACSRRKSYGAARPAPNPFPPSLTRARPPPPDRAGRPDRRASSDLLLDHDCVTNVTLQRRARSCSRTATWSSATSRARRPARCCPSWTALGARPAGRHRGRARRPARRSRRPAGSRRPAPGHPDDAVIWEAVEAQADAGAVPTVSYHVFLVLAVVAGRDRGDHRLRGAGGRGHGRRARSSAPSRPPVAGHRAAAAGAWSGAACGCWCFASRSPIAVVTVLVAARRGLIGLDHPRDGHPAAAQHRLHLAPRPVVVHRRAARRRGRRAGPGHRRRPRPWSASSSASPRSRRPATWRSGWRSGTPGEIAGLARPARRQHRRHGDRRHAVCCSSCAGGGRGSPTRTERRVRPAAGWRLSGGAAR